MQRLNALVSSWSRKQKYFWKKLKYFKKWFTKTLKVEWGCVRLAQLCHELYILLTFQGESKKHHMIFSQANKYWSRIFIFSTMMFAELDICYFFYNLEQCSLLSQSIENSLVMYLVYENSNCLLMIFQWWALNYISFNLSKVFKSIMT